MPRRATKGRAEASLETREALLRAGMTAFADEGLDVPSLDSICERAGFTRGAFYVHFKDRQDFIAAVMDSLTAGFIDSMFGSKDQPSDITEIVTRFATAVTQGKYPIPGTVRLHHVLDACSRDKDIRERRASLYRSAMDVVGHSVREGQQAGTVRREVEAGQVGVLMLAIFLPLAGRPGERRSGPAHFQRPDRKAGPKAPRRSHLRSSASVVKSNEKC